MSKILHTFWAILVNLRCFKAAYREWSEKLYKIFPFGFGDLIGHLNVDSLVVSREKTYKVEVCLTELEILHLPEAKDWLEGGLNTSLFPDFSYASFLDALSSLDESTW